MTFVGVASAVGGVLGGVGSAVGGLAGLAGGAAGAMGAALPYAATGLKAYQTLTANQRIEQANKSMQEALARGATLQEAMYERDQANLQPYAEQGRLASNKVNQLLGLGGDSSSSDYGSFAKPFSETDMRKDPGYTFRFKEGLAALDKSAAARGNLLSGGQSRKLQRYGQDMASNEYQGAFNRYTTEKQNLMNELQRVGVGGLSAAGANSNLNSNYANNMSNMYNQQSQANTAAQGMMGWNEQQLSSGLLNELRDMRNYGRLYEDEL